MKTITSDSLVSMTFDLRWESEEATHAERSFSRVNLWRDLLPGDLRTELTAAGPGDRFRLRMAPGRELPAHDPKKEVALKRDQFDDDAATPRYGRFYPKGLLRGLTNVFPQNVQPFRCVGVESDTLKADLNHPLSKYAIDLTATVADVWQKPYDRGGECASLAECLADGPGMQVRWNGRSTDFTGNGALSREDERPDDRFYAKPRKLNHIDDRAIEEISQLYGGLMAPGMDVLDLMSAWRSHVPESAELRSLVGLGMNAEEMADNPRLTDHVVHDLNADPTVPFPDGSFDRVLCTVSVEYLTQPEAVFRDAARVLRPGGRFVVTFSNRWFPPKAIHLWTELHEFERMGLVMEYFHRSGGFKALETFSSRGWDRPSSDKYSPQMRQADPVYAVWGRKA